MTIPVDALDVWLEDRRVGRLERFEDEAYRFEVDRAYWSDVAHTPLGLELEDRLPRPIESSGLPSWFAHLLPQGPMRSAVARIAGVDVHDGFALLAILGEDLPGAVRVTPIASSYRAPPLSSTPLVGAREALGPIRLALAGVQTKLSVDKQDRKWVLPVVSASGAGSGTSGAWIAKFPDAQMARLPEIEHATQNWARACGIIVPDSQLVSIDDFDLSSLPRGLPDLGGPVFLSRRFDRTRRSRVHMEDFAQVLGRATGEGQYRGSYEQIASVIATVSQHDIHSYLSQLVFCILCGNADAHLKNWSLLHGRGPSTKLSPAYDLLATVLVKGLYRTLALELGGKKDRPFNECGIDAFTAMDQLLRELLNAPNTLPFVAERSRQFREAWRRGRDTFGFSELEREQLDAHLESVPL